MIKVSATYVPQQLMDIHQKHQMAGTNISHTEDFEWENFQHPLYSLNLAPFDFHAFLQLKTESGCWHLANEKSLHAVVDAFKKNRQFMV